MVTTALQAKHFQIYNIEYEKCKAKLISENNYLTQQQAFDCTEQSIKLKILGTLVFAEGSILE